MKIRVLTRSLLAVLFAISGKAQFEIRGSRLYLDGNPFPIRGVAYSPTPIGKTPGPLLQLSGCLYARDFPLAARAGINTIRVYSRIPPGEAPFWQALEKSNLYLLAGFPLEPYYDPGATLSAGSESGRALRARILQDFRDYAEQLRGQQRVIALVFGNEVGNSYNLKFAGSPQDFYSLAGEAAAAVRGMPVTTAIADTADLGQPVPDLAFWSVNVFRGISFNGLFDEVRRKTAKPVLISEFGVDAWDNVRLVEDPDAQSTGLRNLVRLLQQETARADSTLMGGIWFAWSDEWWRGGDPSRHAASNAGWFGLFGLTATDLAGLDSLRPRPAFAVLAQEWGGKLPEDWPAPPRPKLRAPAAPLAPGGLVSLAGEELAEASGRSSDSPLPLQMELTSACVASRPVPLLSIEATQVSGQVPWETPIGTAPALVFRAGVASNVVPLEVRETAPAILDRGVLQAGKPCPVSVANGVRPGTYLEIYGTGLGGVSALLTTGIASAVPRVTDNTPRGFLGSRELRVLYSGLVPGVVGVYQTNIQVPEDFPPGSPLGLRLFAGGIESNPYPLTVVSSTDLPGLLLRDDGLNFVVQAGGPPQAGELSIEGQNGFCELVRFAVAGLPEGLSTVVPVGFPGQRVPVTVQALTGARGQDVQATITAASLLPDTPTARLRITVLPSRGDIPFRVVSGGARAGLVARFEMAGRVLYEARGGGPGRGFSFLVLNGDTGVLGPTKRFDTWLNERASDEMVDYLNALPIGTVVLAAIADEGTYHLTARARAVLRQVLRSQYIDVVQYQDSWAIIARIGAPLAIAEGFSPDRQVVLERVLTF